MTQPKLSQLSIQDHMTKSPVTIACHESLQSAFSLMQTHKIRHLPVLQGSRLVGILSMHDIKRVEAIEQIDASRISVTEAMTPEPYECSPRDRLVDVASQMAAKHIGSTVVCENGEIVGIYTSQDALRSLVQIAGAMA